MTTDQRHLVLSALLDREPVEPDVLAAALEDPDGRAELVDFVRLRAMAATAFVVEERTGTPSSPARPRIARWLARAALVLLPMALGAAGGAWWIEQRDARPPTPTRVVQFVPGVDWK